jgi:protein associated with RNAse G/E
VVVVQFLKYPGTTHWGFEGTLLGEDRFGRWIGVPAGSRRWKAESSRSPTTSPAVFCAPWEGWWHLHYNGPRTTYSHFVDIVTPPRWRGSDRYELIDLDLDVVRYQDGTIEVQDEEEFEEHRSMFGYPEEVAARALEEVAWVVDALADRAEPFFDTAERWLGRLAYSDSHSEQEEHRWPSG